MTSTEFAVAPSPEARRIDRIIGENVHRLMWRAQESQTEVAALLGISQGALSHKLRGKRPWYAGEIDFVAARYGVAHGALFIEVHPPGLEPGTH